MNDLCEETGLLHHYSALERASEEMLRAARAGDWTAVCRLEGACAVVIARLKMLSGHQPLPEHQRAERIRILKNILSNDAEIRRICDPVPAFLAQSPYVMPAASGLLH
jgi:flagellar protein FliT